MSTKGRPLLSTAQAARRLGVKPETLYAYVSRGLLVSARGPDGRSSMFDPADLDRLAQRPGRGGGPRPTVTVHTRLTVVRDGKLFYRGRDATALGLGGSFESAARLLWTGTPDSTSFPSSPQLSATVRAVLTPMSQAPIGELVRVAVLALAAADPLRADLRPDAVAATAATLLGAIVDGLPARAAERLAESATRGECLDEPAVEGRPLAERLWLGLRRAGELHPFGEGSPQASSGASVPSGASSASGASPAGSASPAGGASPAGAARALDAALVLLADDEPDAATLAARVAASARAHPYAVVAAGLAASPPGTAPAVHRALADAEREGSAPVLTRLLTDQRGLPGFGHPSYPSGDPRAALVLELLTDVEPHRARHVAAFLADSRRGTPVPPNVEFALGALTYAAQMSPDSGDAIRALARIAGLVAHAIEEYAEEPGRLRIPATYVGP